MKVLLDEDLPHQLRRHISKHDVFTVRYVGWNGLRNGELLNRAQDAGYEVFVTGDKNLSYQQNLTLRTISVVVLSSQEIDDLLPHLHKIQAAIDRAHPNSFEIVNC